MSTPVSKKRRRKSPHQSQTYSRWFDELKGIHKFSFRKRKNFTGPQKAAITRKMREYRYILGEMRDHDRGVFKKAKPHQLRKLRESGIANEGFIVTNKGVIFPGVRGEKVKKKRQRVAIKGKGKNIRIEIKLPSKRELYIPYDESTGETFYEFTKRVIKQYKPHYVMIQNESGRSFRETFTPRMFLRYVSDTIDPRIKEFKSRYGIDKNPFVGIWLLWDKILKRTFK